MGKRMDRMNALAPTNSTLGRACHRDRRHLLAERHPARGVGLPARQPQRAGMGAGPMEGTQNQRPDGGDSVQHLPLRRPQGEGDRPAPARLHGERGDDEDREGDAVTAASRPPSR